MSYITEYIAGLDKPNCAVSVNGNWLEDLVHGYRTHSVTGRNTSSMEITEVTVGNSNGSRYRRKRDESKDITVSFGITGEDEQSIHKLSEMLQKTLNTAESKFIFYDEQDVYWIGTVNSFSEDWVNASGSDAKAMTGEFVIHCSDPYRYATVETTVTTNGRLGTNAVQLTNNGTVAVPLKIESYMWSGTQLLAYSLDKDNNNSLTYILGTAGSVDSTDSTGTDSKLLIDTDFVAFPTGWAENSGILPPIVTNASQEGSFTYSSSNKGAKATDYGSGSSSTWHGPSISTNIPAVNSYYPQNWRASWAFDFDTGESTNATAIKKKYCGIQGMTFADGSGNPVVSLVMVDSKADSATEVRLYINKTKYIIGSIWGNNIHRLSGGNLTIQKVDSDVHVTYSLPKVSTSNIKKYYNDVDKSTTTLELQGTSRAGAYQRVQGVAYCYFKEADVNASGNYSSVEFRAKVTIRTDHPRDVVYTNPYGGICDVYINDAICCTEYVRITAGMKNGEEVWTSGVRKFRVNHDTDGSKTVKCELRFREGTNPGNDVIYQGMDSQTGYLQLTTFTNEQQSIDNNNGYDTIDVHYTHPNPTTRIRQVTFWAGAYGDDWSSSSSSSGAVSTSGQARFNNNILRTFKFIKYSDTAAVAEENTGYFAEGDVVEVDTNRNVATQNGNVCTKLIDITSEQLMLEPGSHFLKVATDGTPPTMLITYREKWK